MTLWRDLNEFLTKSDEKERQNLANDSKSKARAYLSEEKKRQQREVVVKAEAAAALSTRINEVESAEKAAADKFSFSVTRNGGIIVVTVGERTTAINVDFVQKVALERGESCSASAGYICWNNSSWRYMDRKEYISWSGRYWLGTMPGYPSKHTPSRVMFVGIDEEIFVPPNKTEEFYSSIIRALEDRT